MLCTNKRYLLRLAIVGFFVLSLYAASLAFARPANAAARGGANCDIGLNGGVKSGDTSLPASIKVVFLDSNGNAVGKKINYTVYSYKDTAATIEGGLNITNWTYNTSTGLNDWYKSVSQNTSATCDNASYFPRNYDIYSWRKPLGGGLYDGNGWLLLCKDHTLYGGNPQSPSGATAYFRIKNITPLASYGGDPTGRWMMTGTPWQMSDTKFSVLNGQTKVITFQWQPNQVKIFKYNSPPEHAADPTPRDDLNNTTDVPEPPGNFQVKLRHKIYGNTYLGTTYDSTANPILYSNVPDDYFRIEAGGNAAWKIKKVTFNGVEVSDPYRVDFEPNKPSNMNIVMIWYESVLKEVVICPEASSTFPSVYPYSVAPSDFASIGGTDDNIYGYAFNATQPNYVPIITVQISPHPNGGPFVSFASDDPSNNLFKIRKINDTKGYAWTFELPPGTRNGVQYTADIRWYPNGRSGIHDDVVPNVTWPAGNKCNIDVQASAFPWLQAFGGDVTASNGEIISNFDSGAITRAGQRASIASETEFLVMSFVGGTKTFCSKYDYILTNPSATASPRNCENGAGYKLNAYSLGSTTVDNVVEAAKSAYTAYGGCASVLNQRFNLDPLGTAIPAGAIPAGSTCARGKMYKRAGDLTIGENTLGAVAATTPVNQRATILVDGDLTIRSDIIYENSPKPINQIPSLAIIVKGYIYIKADVQNIQAALYSSKTINTCYERAADSANCFKQLNVSGIMAAREGFYFQRTYWNASRDPAEVVRLTPNLLINTPPGVNLFNFNSYQNSSYISDPSEYQPRY